MTFEQALAAMRRGEKVRQSDNQGYLTMANNEIYECDDNGNNCAHVEAIWTKGIMATDWQIVLSEADQKLHEFNGA